MQHHAYTYSKKQKTLVGLPTHGGIAATARQKTDEGVVVYDGSTWPAGASPDRSAERQTALRADSHITYSD